MADLSDVNMQDARELSEGFTPIEPGEYVAYIDSSEKKESKTTPGNFYLSTVFIIAEGQHENRKFFHNFNLWNKNEVAVNIAKSEWRAVCEATIGKPQASSSDEVHDKKLIITIGLEKDKASDKVRNNIVFRKDTIKAYGGMKAQAPAVTKAAGGKKTPW